MTRAPAAVAAKVSTPNTTPGKSTRPIEPRATIIRLWVEAIINQKINNWYFIQSGRYAMCLGCAKSRATARLPALR
jgi:hypothetical protein